MHGLPRNATVVTGTAVLLARHAAVVVPLDAPFARRGGSPVRCTEADSPEQVQLMTDPRRAVEGGKGTTSKAVRFRLRPDPLAKQGNTRNRWTTIDHKAKTHDLTS